MLRFFLCTSARRRWCFARIFGRTFAVVPKGRSDTSHTVRNTQSTSSLACRLCSSKSHGSSFSMARSDLSCACTDNGPCFFLVDTGIRIILRADRFILVIGGIKKNYSSTPSCLHITRLCIQLPPVGVGRSCAQRHQAELVGVVTR